MTNIKIGKVVEGEITGVTKYGVFVRLEDNFNGLVHISEISNDFVSDIEMQFAIGNIINVKVLDIDEDKLHVKLSIKKISGVLKKKKRGIVERGKGFAPLKEKLDVWINDKLEEIEKKNK